MKIEIDIKQILKENYELNKFKDAVTELQSEMFQRYYTMPTAEWGGVRGPHRKATFEYGGLYAAIIQNIVKGKPRFENTAIEKDRGEGEPAISQATLDAKELLETWKQVEA